MYYTYVLQNPKGLLYKGHTEDIAKRLNQHNAEDGFDSYTKRRGPWKLVYKEEFSTREEAQRREKYLKTGKGREYLRERIGRLSA